MFGRGLFRVQDDASEIVDELVGDLSTRFAPLTDYFQGIYDGVLRQAFSQEGAIELGVIVTAGLLAWLFARPARKLLQRLWPAKDMPRSERARDIVAGLMLPMLWVVLLWTGVAATSQLGFGSSIIRIAASLLNAWIVIRLVSSFVKDRTLAQAFAALAWFVAALNILGLLMPTITLLDSVGFSFGGARLTLFTLIKGVLLAIVFIWAASVASGLVQSRLQRSDRLTPSVQTLVAQGARLTLLFIAVMLVMSAIGVDLTALAVFSGAIGVGIGFGLQSIFSNLMAGIIILLEQSIKVGDFVEFENGLAGEVRERSTS